MTEIAWEFSGALCLCMSPLLISLCEHSVKNYCECNEKFDESKGSPENLAACLMVNEGRCKIIQCDPFLSNHYLNKL